MSDLFHESLAFEDIAAVFGVMAACPQHTFQVLTKRPERAKAFFASVAHKALDFCAVMASDELKCVGVPLDARSMSFAPGRGADEWPLPNVWIGVSVENQATANERIPVLLELPAALRWVSYEPALGPVSFRQWMAWVAGGGVRIERAVSIDWIVVGGESGSGARSFDVAWARSTVGQCLEGGVACFVKQLGAAARDDARGYYPNSELRLRDRKGGDPAEWPEDLRVREYPARRS